MPGTALSTFPLSTFPSSTLTSENAAAMLGCRNHVLSHPNIAWGPQQKEQGLRAGGYSVCPILAGRAEQLRTLVRVRPISSMGLQSHCGFTVVSDSENRCLTSLASQSPKCFDSFFNCNETWIVPWMKSLTLWLCAASNL